MNGQPAEIRIEPRLECQSESIIRSYIWHACSRRYEIDNNVISRELSHRLERKWLTGSEFDQGLSQSTRTSVQLKSDYSKALDNPDKFVCH